MAMLAEPKRKQKFSFDPRNTNWSNDETKFGHKLMEKMGWSKGKGLGVKEDGKTENIAVTLKNDTRGVGCSKSHVDNWIAHQDDFNALLANLGQDHGTAAETNDETDKKVLSLEQTSRSSKGRVHYQKFTKGKDLSLKSAQDLDCVFGKRKNQSGTSTPKTESGANTPLAQSEPSSDSEEKSSGLMTVTSTDSVQEYFKKKMAEKLSKLKNNRDNTVQLDDAWNNRIKVEESEVDKECDEVVTEKKKKSKKRKHESEETVNTNNEIVANDEMDNSINQGEIKKRKKSKKKRKTEKESEIEDDNEGDVTEVNHILVQNDNIENDKPTKKKSKKKKKRSSEVTDSIDFDVIKTEKEEEIIEPVADKESVTEDKPKKKKKNKKRKREGTDEVEAKPVKQKKRVTFMLGVDDDSEDIEKDVSEELSDKIVVKIEPAGTECNIEKKLDSSKCELSDEIKNTAASSTLKACSDSDNLEIKPNNIDIKKESVTKSASKVNDSGRKVKNRGRKELMSVIEVKKAGEAFRGANISNVKGYTGMMITPTEVKKKLDKKKQW